MFNIKQTRWIVFLVIPFFLTGCAWLGGWWGSDDSPQQPQAESGNEPLVMPGEVENGSQGSSQQSTTTPTTQRNPQRARELAVQAQQAFQNNNIQAAIQNFEQATRYDPQNADIQYNLASLYYRQQRYSEARDHYQKVVQIDPDDHMAHYYLGLSYQKMGNYQQARRHYQRVLELDPDNQKAQSHLNNLPTSQMATEPSSSSRSGSSQQVRILPEKQEGSSGATGNRQRASRLTDEALRDYRNGNVETAMRTFQRAAELDPSNPDVHFNLGTIYFDRGQYQQARNHYQRVVEITPEDATAHYYLGLTYQRLGNTSRARSEYQRVLDLSPDHSKARRRLQQLGS